GSFTPVQSKAHAEGVRSANPSARATNRTQGSPLFDYAGGCASEMLTLPYETLKIRSLILEMWSKLNQAGRICFSVLPATFLKRYVHRGFRSENQRGLWCTREAYGQSVFKSSSLRLRKRRSLLTRLKGYL